MTIDEALTHAADDDGSRSTEVVRVLADEVARNRVALQRLETATRDAVLLAVSRASVETCEVIRREAYDRGYRAAQARYSGDKL